MQQEGAKKQCAVHAIFFLLAAVMLVIDASAEPKLVSVPTALTEISSLKLRIRSVFGLGMLDDQALRARENIIVDTRLRDLDRELHALPFQMYQLLDEVSLPVSLKRKEDVRLVTGQTLKLRVLSETPDGLIVWLRWQDRGGALLLDTRLLLEYENNVLAGAEGLNRTGPILAIAASRAK